MSGLSSEAWIEYARAASGLAIPGLALVAALLGGTHCVGMCGGIALAASSSRRSFWSYQLSRLAGYLFAGALAGLFGEGILRTTWGSQLPWIAAVGVSLALVGTGVSMVRGGALPELPDVASRPLQSIWARICGKLVRDPRWRPWVMGFFTFLLPCGWLYAFVLVAVGTRSTVLGALVLLALWSGSLAALAVGRPLLEQLQRRMPLKQGWVLGALLIALGMSNLWAKVEARPVPEPVADRAIEMPCHHGSH